MATDTWAAYYRRWRVLGPQIEAHLKKFSAVALHELWEDDGGDSGWHLTIPRSDGNILDVCFKLVDAGEAGDHEAGVRGNLMLELIADGGLVVGNLSPGNYTKDCWVPYRNAAEFQRRLDLIIAADLESAIQEWLDKADEKAKGITVAELIAKLQQLPQDMIVLTDHRFGAHEFQSIPRGVGVVETDDAVDDNNDPLPAGEYVAITFTNTGRLNGTLDTGRGCRLSEIERRPVSFYSLAKSQVKAASSGNLREQ